MSLREKEVSTLSACPFESGFVDPYTWQPTVDSSISNSSQILAVLSASGCSVRIAPMNRIGGGSHGKPKWQSDVHFHDALKVQVGGEDSENQTLQLCCCFESIARECIAIAISTTRGYKRGRTYEICFGARGNTMVTVERSGRNSQGVGVPSRVCRENAWTPYWVCLVQSKIYVGVGLPGEKCIAILDDSSVANDTIEDAEESMGIETNDNQNAEGQDGIPAGIRSVQNQKEPNTRYVGFGNAGVADRQAPTPLKVRGIRLVSTIPDALKEKLTHLQPESLEMVVLESENHEDDEHTRSLWKEYQEECKKARARAAKFGVPYKEPAPDAFVPWSEARRLRANPKTGFATGIDLFDPTEKAKQEARKRRFGIGETNDVASELPPSHESSHESASDALPVVQAWDNEELTRRLRTDPPESLWKVPPVSIEEEVVDKFSMSATTSASFTPEKIHIFSIDWAAFKQIRSDDVMAYFSVYGPSYVEWLGDLSCNVLFEDKFSAARALEMMSTELPSEIPEEVSNSLEPDNHVPNLGAMGWRMGRKLLRKISNDKYGRRGTTARLLMRAATSLDILSVRPTSWLKPPPGFSTNRVLGPGSDSRKKSGGGRKRRKFQTDSVVSESEGDHPLLQRALRSGREGFTVEQLEAERAKKTNSE